MHRGLKDTWHSRRAAALLYDCRILPPDAFPLQHLGPWIKSSKEHERQRAVEVSAALLDFYLSKLNVSVSERGAPASPPSRRCLPCWGSHARPCPRGARVVS